MESKGSVSSPEDEPISEWRLSSGPHYSSFTNSLSSLAPEEVEKQALSQKRAYITVALLCYINLVNYMDRYIVAGEMMSTVHMLIALCIQQLSLHAFDPLPYIITIMQVSSPTFSNTSL